MRTVDTDVLVVSVKSSLTAERMQLCAELWGKNIKVCLQRRVVVVAVVAADAVVCCCLRRACDCDSLTSFVRQAEFMYTDKPNMKTHIEYALESEIPYMAIIGEDEIATGIVKFKDMVKKEQIDLPRAGFADAVAAYIRKAKEPTA